jgi:myo-inositol-1(or 4)-monophosphatase
VASVLLDLEFPGMNDLELARAAARLAADVIRPLQVRSVSYKGDSNPVTNTDLEAQERILSLLGKERPGDSVLSEEQDGTYVAGGRWWLVDPLDGTVNFVHGIPHVAVSIALYTDGSPVVGVVLDVFRDEEFSASAGGGAWLGSDPLHVSTSRLEDAVAATGFPYDHKERGALYGAMIGAVLPHVQGLRRMGTAALDLAWVAAGRYDAYWELKLHPWDVAAGILIVREAGGVVTDSAGSPSTPYDDHFIASNGAIHKAWRMIVASAIQGGERND